MVLIPTVDPSYIPCKTQKEQVFLQRIVNPLGQCIHQFDNDGFKQAALKIIPVQKIHDSAKTSFQQQGPNGTLGYDDHVIKALLHWFKHEFFKWVNSPEWYG